MAHASALGIPYPNRRRFVADKPGYQLDCLAQRGPDEAHTRIVSDNDIAHRQTKGTKIGQEAAFPASLHRDCEGQA